MQMKLGALALSCALLLAPAVQAGPRDEAMETYLAFAAAQNAHDLEAVGELFIDSDDFLWVSDGQTFWGRQATLERMALFQRAPVWRVEPWLDRATAVEVNPTTAYLHLPLTLVIGSQEKPDRLDFLVSVLCVDTPEGWRIAALFTTTYKGPARES